MRWVRLLGLVALLALVAACGGAPSSRDRTPGPARAVSALTEPPAVATPDAPPGIAALRRRVQALLDRDRVAGAGLVLATRYGVVWSGGVGLADRATGRPVTAHTPFRLGSVSKNVTALAIMQLVEEGRLSLDARLRDLAPEVGFRNPWEADHPVLLAQLLEHTAGFEFARFNEEFDDRTEPRSLREALATNPRSRVSRWPPGTRMSYSNEGYLVAGYLLEKLTGKPFDAVVHDSVFSPLGMRTAAFKFTPETAGELARGYGGGGGAYPYEEDMMRPAANLLASPEDMGRYLTMLLRRGEVDGRRLLSPDGLARMEERRTLPYAGPDERYGLGTQVGQLDGHVVLGHTGYTRGFRASLRYLPSEGVGWTVMLNSADSERTVADIEQELLRFLVPDPVGPPPTSPPPPRPEELAVLSGFYRDVTPGGDFGAPLRLLFGGDELEVRHGALCERPIGTGGLLSVLRPPPWAPLVALGGGAFRRSGERISSLYFTRAPDGGEVLVTADGYLERSWLWPLGVARLALLAAFAVLIGSVLVLPVWVVPAAVSGRLPVGAWARALPALAAVVAVASYLLVVRSPQPLGRVNATTLAIFVLSVCFALISALAVVAALATLRGDGGWFVKAQSLLAAGACAGLSAFAASAHWIGIRTWSW